MRHGIQPETTKFVLSRCTAVWRDLGVEPGVRTEMRVELEEHLRQGRRHGKSVEDVIGFDVDEFARTWAHSNISSKSVNEDILALFYTPFLLLSGVALFAHWLWESSVLSVPLDIGAAFLLLALLFAWLLAELKIPNERNLATEGSGVDGSVWDLIPFWIRCIFLAPALLAISTFVDGPLGGSATFEWPLVATAVSLIIGVLLRVSRRAIANRLPNAQGKKRRSNLHEYYALYEPEKVSDRIVEDCISHWRKGFGIPGARAKEMGEEVRQHLEAALEDGKSVESVVGDDVEAFAESWAEEADVKRSTGDLAIIIVFAIFAFSALTAGLAHLYRWSLEVPLFWFPLVLLILLGFWLTRWSIAKLRAPQTKRAWKHGLAAISGSLLISVMGSGIFLTSIIWEQIPALSDLLWPWYATVGVTVVAAATTFLWNRRTN